jgi:hypothetical protein
MAYGSSDVGGASGTRGSSGATRRQQTHCDALYAEIRLSGTHREASRRADLAQERCGEVGAEWPTSSPGATTEGTKRDLGCVSVLISQSAEQPDVVGLKRQALLIEEGQVCLKDLKRSSSRQTADAARQAAAKGAGARSVD